MGSESVKRDEVKNLKEKLKELEDREQALKNTMEKADEIFFKREKVNEEKLKGMKEALKKSTDFADLSNCELNEQIEVLEKKCSKLEEDSEKTKTELLTSVKNKEKLEEETKEL